MNRLSLASAHPDQRGNSNRVPLLNSEHDAAFPAHPVSRLRRLLKGIENTAALDEEIRRLPKFRLPGGAP
jgi:hypothetical protein